ncbi:hypothetical protein E2C01_040645 [Portunus trituberculatus]|uniref:Uncharacterized protein n=1 Tax=Portunus trituberculatus TaxID=210409 RepID=A0A5B7FN69_PORTR|nr:hypothetical protein [Portunus trituberculatus]
MARCTGSGRLTPTNDTHKQEWRGGALVFRSGSSWKTAKATDILPCWIREGGSRRGGEAAGCFSLTHLHHGCHHHHARRRRQLSSRKKRAWRVTPTILGKDGLVKLDGRATVIRAGGQAGGEVGGRGRLHPRHRRGDSWVQCYPTYGNAGPLLKVPLSDHHHHHRRRRPLTSKRGAACVPGENRAADR